MKKLLLVLAVLALLPVPAASAATIVNDSYLIGTVIPGTPSGDLLEFQRLEFFVDWYNTGTEPTPPPNCNSCSYDLYNAGAFGTPLPDPVALGAVKTAWSSNSFTLPGPYLYMEVKFGENSAYYYIGGLAGELTLMAPDAFVELGKGVGVSHVSLFNPSVVVPEPATMLLLGTGLLGLAGIARRRRR